MLLSISLQLSFNFYLLRKLFINPHVLVYLNKMELLDIKIETIRTLSLHNNVPIRFLGDAVITTCYLINRMPSSVL